jgi:hypothetical protein
MRNLFPLGLATLALSACGASDIQITDAATSDVAVTTDAAIADARADVITTDGGTPDLGWTQLHGLPGTKDGYLHAIYVDGTGGSDANDGLSPATPLQHIDDTSKLYKMLKGLGGASETIVLLKPGSEWVDEYLFAPVSGSKDYPLLFSGTMWPNAGTTARPKVRSGVRIPYVSHVALEGLEIGPNPPSPDGGPTSSLGVFINAPGGTDYLVEDCLITRFFNLILAEGGPTAHVSNIRVRRNYLFGAYGGGAVGAFNGEDIDGALFEENFFDYNGGPKGDYENPSLVAPYSNALAHDIYFFDDGTHVVAANVTFRRNLFARTLLSMKGPYSGELDDNLFYNYWDGGYVGTSGATFHNNVLVNGAGFSAGLDNAHDPNTDPTAKTRFCNNLEYNEKPGGTAFQSPAYYKWVTGVNLEYSGNVIDGFASAFEFRDLGCFGYRFTDNVVQANQLYTFATTPQCPFSASGNAYHMPEGTTAQSFASLETRIGETDGAYSDQAFVFSDPARNISSYLVASGLAGSNGSPTLIDYLSAIRAQAAVPHTWNASLDVANVNAYLREGHSREGHPLAYRATCP